MSEKDRIEFLGAVVADVVEEKDPDLAAEIRERVGRDVRDCGPVIFWRAFARAIGFGNCSLRPEKVEGSYAAWSLEWWCRVRRNGQSSTFGGRIQLDLDRAVALGGEGPAWLEEQAAAEAADVRDRIAHGPFEVTDDGAAGRILRRLALPGEFMAIEREPRRCRCRAGLEAIGRAGLLPRAILPTGDAVEVRCGGCGRVVVVDVEPAETGPGLAVDPAVGQVPGGIS